MPLSINNKTYFFSVKHITKELSNKLIYGIRLNMNSYFLSKSSNLGDCEQIDCKPTLDPIVLKEICLVISEIERENKVRPTLAFINMEIFRILGRIRNTLPQLSN